METAPRKCRLVLQDGSVYTGISFGAESNRSGEVVFNTGMVGYPETLTDPSYKGQILVFTYPLIGNYGIPGDEKDNSLLRNFESEKIHVQGLIVAENCNAYSHWDAKKSLSQWLTDHGIPGISGIDTRALTKKLRTAGTMLGKILFDDTTDIPFDDPNRRNLAAEVSIAEAIVYPSGKKRVVLVDCGTKNNIIRAFLKRNLTIIRLPWGRGLYERQTSWPDSLQWPRRSNDVPGDNRQCPPDPIIESSDSRHLPWITNPGSRRRRPNL